jgi:hypothetical protein
MEDKIKNPWLDLSNPLRRVINPDDGQAFIFVRNIQYYTLAFLCAVAAVVMFLPSNWLDNDLIQSFCNTIKNF